jgi:lysophospholipase L1-like esterase
MNALPYPLEFVHKYNLFKWLGFAIEEDDLASIARIYGVPLSELEAIEQRFQETVSRLAQRLAEERPLRPAPAPLTLLALGDSLTSDRQSWVKILRRYWAADPSRQIIDSAVSGDTATSVLNRLHRTVLRHRFERAVVLLGTNDCRRMDEPDGLTNLSLEEYQRDLRYLTLRLMRHGAALVLVTLPPVDTERLKRFFTETNSTYDAERLEATNEFLRALAAERGAQLADLAAAASAAGEDILEEDGLHLNATGQYLLAKLVAELTD